MSKFLGTVLAVFVVSTTSALAAPQSYYNKTVRVSWSETRSQRLQGEGAFKSQSFPFSFAVYVSSKGQLFRRLTAATASGKRTGTRDRVGASSSSEEGAGQVTFQGNTMVSTTNNGGLGRRIRVSFDGGSSCSAEVLTGKTGAGISTLRSTASGKMVEFESVSASGASCSVQDGNAFAD